MITGLFADTLKACANWFLYIFISADAPLNTEIMTRRTWQIKILKMLDAINTTYNYSELADIVYEGIVELYGKTPAEVLTELYNVSVKINGIGSVISDKATAKVAEELKNLQITTIKNNVTKKENVWDTISEVWLYIKEILTIIGVKPDKTAETIKPKYTDWVIPDKGSKKSSSTYLSSVGDILPWLMAGTIIYALSTGTNKKQQKQKER